MNYATMLSESDELDLVKTKVSEIHVSYIWLCRKTTPDTAYYILSFITGFTTDVTRQMSMYFNKEQHRIQSVTLLLEEIVHMYCDCCDAHYKKELYIRKGIIHQYKPCSGCYCCLGTEMFN